MTRIAIAGKGGSGKTTIAGTLARLLARRGRQVLAVDGDSNPNLAVSLGLARDDALALPTVPGDVLRRVELEDGSRRTELALPPAEVASRYGTACPDGVTLLVMGRVGHAGAG